MRKNLGITLALFVLAITGCSKQAKLTRHLQRADGYYAAGDYDKADLEYINALRTDPNSKAPGLARAYARIGIMSMEDGRLSRAMAALAIACKNDTNNLEYRTKLALVLVGVGRSKEARAGAMYVLSHDPQNQEAPLTLADASQSPKDLQDSQKYLQSLAVAAGKRAAVDVALGNMAMRQRDLKSAFVYFESARKADPKFSALHSSLAVYYALQNDLPHADAEFKAAAADTPVRSVARLLYARFKTVAGDAAGAKLMLQETTQKAPDYIPGLLMLAEIQGAQTNLNEAAASIGKVLSRDPESFQGLLLSGQIAMAQTNAAKAVIDFEKLTKSYPKSEVAFYRLATAYSAVNDSQKTIATLNQALALNPKFTEASQLLAQVKIATGDFSAAVSILRQLTQQNPQSAPAHFLLADAYSRLGNTAGAEQVFREFLAANPANDDAHFLLGNLLVRDRRDQARQEFNKAYELAPKSLRNVETLTDLDIVEKQYPAALERLRKFSEGDAAAPEPQLLMAKVWVAQGDMNQGAAIMDKIITSHPNYLPAYISLGNLYSENKDYPHALEAARRLLAKFPGNPSGELLVALVSEATKDFKSAREAYEKVLESNPRNIAALNNLAYLDLQNNELDKAYELAKKAHELAPQELSTTDTLGWICYQRGDYEQAINLLRDTVRYRSNSSEIQMHYGMACYMSGDEEHARASLQYAAQSKDDFPQKQLALRSLAVLAIDPKTANADARGTLEKAVADQPGDAIALSRLAAINVREGNVEKAIANFNAVLKASPKNARAMLQLARLHATRPGENQKAFELVKSAYKIAPEDLETSVMLGQLALQNGDYKLAYDLLKEAVRKSPGDADLQFGLAQAAYSQGRLNEALSDTRGALQNTANFPQAADARRFLDMVVLGDDRAAAMAAGPQIEQTLKADSGYVPALMASGTIQEAKNDSASAIETYKKALAKYPDFIPAKRRLAILFAPQPANDKLAYEYASQARDVYPNDSDLEEALGIIVYRQGDYTRSARYLQDCQAKKNGDPQLLYYLGMAQFQLRDRASSKKNLLQAVNLKLPDNLAGEAKKALAQMN